jgi:predicted DCC family thiol-disulfide oxidoreductase YuxK
MTDKHTIVFFDGVCNLCNQSVLFIIKRDKKEQFKFASLQSTYAKETLKKYNYDTTSLHSLVLLEGEIVHVKSAAVLKILRELTWYGKVLYVFKIIPTPIRDLFYNFIAKRRYKWFGKKEVCMIPSDELKKRFLDNT